MRLWLSAENIHLIQSPRCGPRSLDNQPNPKCIHLTSTQGRCVLSSQISIMSTTLSLRLPPSGPWHFGPRPSKAAKPARDGGVEVASHRSPTGQCMLRSKQIRHVTRRRIAEATLEVPSSSPDRALLARQQADAQPQETEHGLVAERRRVVIEHALELGRRCPFVLRDLAVGGQRHVLAAHPQARRPEQRRLPVDATARVVPPVPHRTIGQADAGGNEWQHLRSQLLLDRPPH
mmetsp:Transcript_60898/g.199404  ORF Transcript_60898/g.199404 Transcript_60898/m.199404 type:complete len:233 (+) Transcript_60898:236-934(+)